MTCTHDCGCTREAEPSKADCYRCWSASKRGTACVVQERQHDGAILTLLHDARTLGVGWLHGSSIEAAILGVTVDMHDAATLIRALQRMVASGAIAIHPDSPWGADRYCLPVVAEQALADRVVRGPRTPMDTLLGKATLEAKVGEDVAADIIAGSTR